MSGINFAVVDASGRVISTGRATNPTAFARRKAVNDAAKLYTVYTLIEVDRESNYFPAGSLFKDVPITETNGVEWVVDIGLALSRPASTVTVDLTTIDTVGGASDEATFSNLNGFAAVTVVGADTKFKSIWEESGNPMKLTFDTADTLTVTVENFPEVPKDFTITVQ